MEAIRDFIAKHATTQNIIIVALIVIIIIVIYRSRIAQQRPTKGRAATPQATGSTDASTRGDALIASLVQSGVATTTDASATLPPAPQAPEANEVAL